MNEKTVTATLTSSLYVQKYVGNGRQTTVSLPRGAKVTVQMNSGTWKVTYQGREYRADRKTVWDATA